MGKDSEDKTRREKRKEARLQKNKKKHDSWVQHHKIKKTMSNQKAKKNTQTAEEKDTVIEELLKTEFEECKKDADTEASRKRTVSSQKDDQSLRKRKAKFEKYLELENHSAKEDLALERKLAKKLKVKNRKLGGEDDGLNILFEGTSSIFDIEEMEEANIPRKKHKKNSKKKLDLDADIESDDVVEQLKTEYENNDAQAPVMEKHAKYVPPQLRSMSRNESEEYSQIQKRVRGLLNRLGESNVEGITGEMASIFQSISRSDGAQIISEEILTSCSGGPRGNEQLSPAIIP